MGGYQISFSDYYDITANKLLTPTYGHTIYGIQAGLITKHIGIGLWVSHHSFSNVRTPRYIDGIPSANLFKTQRYFFPVAQIGASLSTPVFTQKKWDIDILLLGGINRWLENETHIESFRDTLSATTQYGTTYLGVYSISSAKYGNMFLGSGLQMRYKILNHLVLNATFQYQLGIGVLSGVTTTYHTWGDSTVPTFINNASTINGSNLNLRVSLLYEFGKEKEKKK